MSGQVNIKIVHRNCGDLYAGRTIPCRLVPERDFDRNSTLEKQVVVVFTQKAKLELATEYAGLSYRRNVIGPACLAMYFGESKEVNTEARYAFFSNL